MSNRLGHILELAPGGCLEAAYVVQGAEKLFPDNPLSAGEKLSHARVHRKIEDLRE